MKITLPIVFLAVVLGSSSCVSHQELLYLRDLPVNADVTDTIKNISQADLRLQPDDLLSITVTSYNLEASKPFNMDANSMQSMAQALQGGSNVAEMLTGYFVDQEGFIDFPVLGRLDVNRKTLTETKALLYGKLKTYLKDPVVNIRYLNLKVSILGEVTKPGTLRLTNKRLTIFEAIGMVGDMTPYANRSNVVVIREKNGRRSIKRINLQSAEIFTSPFYYLQQNDVVYVEPNKTKVNTIADQSSRVLSYVSTALSILTIAFTLILRKP